MYGKEKVARGPEEEQRGNKKKNSFGMKKTA